MEDTTADELDPDWSVLKGGGRARRDAVAPLPIKMRDGPVLPTEMKRLAPDDHPGSKNTALEPAHKKRRMGMPSPTYGELAEESAFNPDDVIWLKSVDPQTPQKGLRPQPTMPAAVRTPQSAPSARKGGICKCCRSVRSMRDGRQMNIRTCGKLHPCLKAFSADEAERLEAHRVVHNRCEHAVWLAQASTAKPIRLDRGNNITLAGNFWEVSSDGHKQSSQDFADWLKTARTEPNNQRRGEGCIHIVQERSGNTFRDGGYAPAVAKYLRAEKGQRDKYVWMYSEEDSSGQNKILYTNSKQIEAFYKGHVLYPANGMQGGLIGNFGFGIAENDCQICFATMTQRSSHSQTTRSVYREVRRVSSSLSSASPSVTAAGASESLNDVQEVTGRKRKKCNGDASGTQPSE